MKFKIKKIILPLFFSLTSFGVFSNTNDCIHEAAQCFKINPLIIRAIIWQESNNKQNVISVNKNKTIDIGVMQINSIHFDNLRSQGISEKELKENSCSNVFSGVWILNNVIQDAGYTWEGIGRYHSKTPMFRDRYISGLIEIIVNNNKIINDIQIPYKTGIREKFHCR